MVKIVDVAEAAGVNPSTVSRALNDSSDINEETKEYIRTIANELGYRPNFIARALAGKGIKTIGIIVPEVLSNHFGQLITYTEEYLKARGYSLVIALTHYNLTDEIECIEGMFMRSVDGFIFVFPSDAVIAETLVKLEKKYKMPLVTIQPPDLGAFYEFCNITIDDFHGYDLLLKWLYTKGCREIAWLQDRSPGAHRLRPCKYAADKYGIRLQDCNIITSDVMFEIGGFQSMSRLLEQGNIPAAIVASYDYLAIGAMRAALDKGMRIPEDVIICGYDGIREIAFLPYFLPSIVPPYKEIACNAVNILLDKIENNTTVKQNLSLIPSLRF